jgi:hypothetical protein
VQPVNSLARAKTTLNAPNARERIEDDAAGVGASQSALPRGNDVPAATSIGRNNSAIAAGRPGQASFPMRGLSVRRPSAEDAPPPTSFKNSVLTIFRFLYSLTRWLVSQRELRGQPTSTIILWIRMLNDLQRYRWQATTTIVSQTGHEATQAGLHAHRVRVRLEAPVLAP